MGTFVFLEQDQPAQLDIFTWVFSLTFCVEAVWYTFKRQFPLLFVFAVHSHGNGNIPPLAETRRKAWKHSGQSLAQTPVLYVRPPEYIKSLPPVARAENTDALQSTSSHCPAWYLVIYGLRMTRPLFSTWKKNWIIANCGKGKLRRSLAISSCTTYC